MKKGFTLIEFIAVLGILSIIFSIGSGGYKLYEGIRYDVEVEKFLYELEDSFCFGREYCLNNYVNGTISLEEYKDKFTIKFKGSNGYVNRKDFDKSLTLDDVYIVSYPYIDNYYIKVDGMIIAHTTSFKDRDNNKYQVSINPTFNNIYVGKKR